MRSIDSGNLFVSIPLLQGRVYHAAFPDPIRIFKQTDHSGSATQDRHKVKD